MKINVNLLKLCMEYYGLFFGHGVYVLLYTCNVSEAQSPVVIWKLSLSLLLLTNRCRNIRWQKRTCKNWFRLLLVCKKKWWRSGSLLSRFKRSVVFSLEKFLKIFVYCTTVRLQLWTMQKISKNVVGIYSPQKTVCRFVRLYHFFCVVMMNVYMNKLSAILGGTIPELFIVWPNQICGGGLCSHRGLCSEKTCLSKHFVSSKPWPCVFSLWQPLFYWIWISLKSLTCWLLFLICCVFSVPVKSWAYTRKRNSQAKFTG